MPIGGKLRDKLTEVNLLVPSLIRNSGRSVTISPSETICMCVLVITPTYRHFLFKAKRKFHFKMHPTLQRFKVKQFEITKKCKNENDNRRKRKKMFRLSKKRIHKQWKSDNRLPIFDIANCNDRKTCSDNGNYHNAVCD